ncbi:hypothetical protein JCM10908_002807 [Rhodotorula pacifica]|uniref:uncharacterized protein n=1 Tax=Rhodotorula pacifica TaxID=1495444 RepID=UPI003171FC2F
MTSPVHAVDEISFAASQFERGYEYSYGSYSSRGSPVETIRTIGSVPNIRSALAKAGLAASAIVEPVALLGNEFLVGLQWRGVEKGAFVKAIRLRISVDSVKVLDATVEWQFFPAGQRGILWSEPLATRDTGTVKYEVQMQAGTAAVMHPDWMDATAKKMFADAHQQVANDVCFVFDDLELWTSEALLSGSSPYFKTLLASVFAEGSQHVGKVEKPSVVGVRHRQPEDSDDETDELLASHFRRAVKEMKVPSQPYKRVVVRDTAYTTYAAVLTWLACRLIEFTPLKSKSQEARTAKLEIFSKDKPLLPPPASPKSVYRLAHLLELEDLQKEALHDFAQQLTPACVPTELFSAVACSYPAVRNLALDAALANWTAVRETSAWKEMERLADENLLPPGAAHTAILLAARISCHGIAARARSSKRHGLSEEKARAPPSSSELRQSSVADNSSWVLGELENAKRALKLPTTAKLQLVSLSLGSPPVRYLSISWEEASGPTFFEAIRVLVQADTRTVLDETLLLQRFPSSSAGMLRVGLFESSTEKIVVKMEFTCADPSHLTLERARLTTEQILGYALRQTSHDVCLAFAGLKMHLWATEACLTTASRYLKAQLESDFAEGRTINGDVTIDPAEDIQQRTLEGSDDESDENLREFYLTRSKNSKSSISLYKKVIVRQAAYTTYSAVLVWLSCRQIQYAPLRSRGPQTRKARINRFAAAGSQLPAPASPKSVYRLAHLLEIAELRQSALANFRAQLTPDNVADELF